MIMWKTLFIGIEKHHFRFLVVLW